MKKSIYALYGVGILLIVFNLIGIPAFFFRESYIANFIRIIWVTLSSLLGVIMGTLFILFANVQVDSAEHEDKLNLSLGRNHKTDLELTQLRQEIAELRDRLFAMNPRAAAPTGTLDSEHKEKE